jgi:hypothetical protein
MLKQNLMIIVFAGSIGLMNGSVFASEHAYSESHAIQNLEGTHLIGGHLMTNEEMREYQQKMNNAKTPEEREQILRENHQKMEARAKERGVPLRKMPNGQQDMMDNRNMPNGNQDSRPMSPTSNENNHMSGQHMH